MYKIKSEYENNKEQYKNKLAKLYNLRKQYDDATAEAILGPCHEDEPPCVKGISDQMRTLASRILIFILKHFEIPSIASPNLNPPIRLFLKEIADPTLEPEFDSNKTSENGINFIFELKTSNGKIIDKILLNSDKTPEIAAMLFKMGKLVKVICPFYVGVCEYRLKHTEGPESHTVPYYPKPSNRNANGKVRMNSIGYVELEYEGKVIYDGNTRKEPREQNSISCFPIKAFAFRKSAKKQPKNGVMKPPSPSRSSQQTK